MTTLVLGGHGLLGSALARDGVIALSRNACDILNPAAIALAIDGFRPSKIINCAAFTSVDKAEANRREALAVNADGAENIAIACQRHGIPLVHVSTDYVFDGKKGCYTEQDKVGPIQFYGESKLFGEALIRGECPGAAIVRTSGLYSALTGRGLVSSTTWLVYNAKVVIDQTLSPTAVEDLAEALLVVAEGQLYHFAGPAASRHALCALVAHRIGASALVVGPVKGLVPRPRNSSLDSSAFLQAYGLRARPWQQGILQGLEALLETSR